MRDISYCIVNTENLWALGEFRGSFLGTTVWFEVLAGFHLLYVLFAISKTEKC